MQLIQSIVKCVQDKKAEDIKILDMRAVANFCDYFIICSGTSDRQVKAIAEGIEEGLDELGIKVRYRQGLRGVNPIKQLGTEEMIGSWVLLDMGDVVVHVFEPNAREFYALEYLWRDAPEVALAAAKKPRRKKKK